MSFQLIPITGKNMVEKWGYFIDGMEKLRKYSRNSDNLPLIYNDILSGAAIIWAGFFDSKYIGFIVTQILQAPGEERRMLIRSIYSNTKLSDEVYQEGFQILDEHAKKMQAKKMEFYTIRDRAWEKNLKQFGWKQKYAIFERDLGGDTSG